MTGSTQIVECMHGARSPQAQKMVIKKSINWKEKMKLAAEIVKDTGETVLK